MSETRLFGTDGVRAPFGEPPLDRETVTALAVALGRTLREGRPGHGTATAAPEVVLGGDTRASTPEICRWVAAGLEASGVRTRYLGTVPTPAVAFLASAVGAAAGVAVSASHNPLPDNGVKLLDGAGAKWETAAEAALEARIEDGDCRQMARRLMDGLPDLVPEPDLVQLYLDHLGRTLAGLDGRRPAAHPLGGLRIALDAAHGAAAPYAAALFTSLGADVTALCDAPDGSNINDGCGSTHPEKLAETVRQGGFDLGFAFDGDADRALPVDAEGQVRDGDAVLYLWATALHEAGRLEPPAVVATSMSNLGLARSLEEHGVHLVRCGVGDREVVATLRREGLVLGGEQSGHVVHLDLSTTGDGLLTALQVAARVAAAGRPVVDLLAGFRRFPQVLRNVRVARKPPLDSLPAVRTAVERVESELGESGRLVLRYSGTEPLARVMIEGQDQETIDGLADGLAAAIEEEVGA